MPLLPGWSRGAGLHPCCARPELGGDLRMGGLSPRLPGWGRGLAQHELRDMQELGSGGKGGKT